MFMVLDNGTPAVKPLESVENCMFDEFNKAVRYAKNYLVAYSSNVRIKRPDIKYDYTGFNDFIEIRYL